MKYPFPVIKHISEVLPAIEGSKEFIVAEKDGGYTVVNYVVSTSETFPDIILDSSGNFATEQDRLNAIRRECRGLIFETSSGKILHRRLNKFFNVGERDETQTRNVPLSNFTIMEKLDGSMITPVLTEQGIRWGTKMGVTQVALPVEEFVVKNKHYADFARICMDKDVTPIFEWCSNQQRIVLSYPKDELKLLAIRQTVTGEYFTQEQIHELIKETSLNIPIVKTWDSNQFTWDELINQIRILEGQEGIVLAFDNGHRVKVKSDWYVKIHRAKDSLSREKDVIQLILDEKIDDLKPHLLEQDLEMLNVFETNFWQGIQENKEKILQEFIRMRDLANGDRKVFAMDHVSNVDGILRPIYFKLWEGAETLDLLRNLIIKNASTQTKLNTVRHLWNNHTWGIQQEE